MLTIWCLVDDHVYISTDSKSTIWSNDLATSSSPTGTERKPKNEALGRAVLQPSSSYSTSFMSSSLHLIRLVSCPIKQFIFIYICGWTPDIKNNSRRQMTNSNWSNCGDGHPQCSRSAEWAQGSRSWQWHMPGNISSAASATCLFKCLYGGTIWATCWLVRVDPIWAQDNHRMLWGWGAIIVFSKW